MAIISKKYLSLLYADLLSMISYICTILSPNNACRVQNAFCFVLRSQTRYSWCNQSEKFIAEENNKKRYFHSIKRGFDCYTLGLEKRGEQLITSYVIDKIDFNSDDIIVDCGANYGDLFLNLSDEIREDNYFCIEPSPSEFECLKLSLPKASIRQIGLAEKTGHMEFYVSSETADSSVIQPKKYESIIKIEVITLDEFAKQAGISRCKLFKLEAEGYEYEILLGGKNFVKNCEYITVDGGAERGHSDEPTLPEISNFLFHMGFEMTGLFAGQSRALFKNTSNEPKRN